MVDQSALFTYSISVSETTPHGVHAHPNVDEYDVNELAFNRPVRAKHIPKMPTAKGKSIIENSP